MVVSASQTTEDQAHIPADGGGDSPWSTIPRDVAHSIMKRLGMVDTLLRFRKVCLAWASCCHDPSLWRTIKLACPDPVLAADYRTACCDAVELGRRHVIDLFIENFIDNQSMMFIAARAFNLRRLSFVFTSNWDLSASTLTIACARFHMLEELHLLTPLFISHGDIRKIGLACPRLRSFTLTRSTANTWLNLDAMAIAASMNGLNHLCIIGNGIDNRALLAILNCLHNLRTLDLRRCRRLELEGDIGQILRASVHGLRLPHESLDDYPYEVFDYDALPDVDEDGDDDGDW